MAEYTTERIAEFLKAANRCLGSNKYKAENMMTDYAKSIIMGKQLLKENEELRAKLENTENNIEEVKKRFSKYLQK